MSYGIKVSKPGNDVKTATDPELVFGSMFNTLRIAQQGTGTLTDSTRTITIAHNLGYVPAFMVHSQFSTGTDYYISPLINTQPYFFPQSNGEILAWADSTNLYIKAQNSVGYSNFVIGSQSANNALANEGSSYGYDTGFAGFGYNNTIPETYNGALRFENVALTQGQTISHATLNFYISYRIGTGNVNANVYGIAEDDTVSFDSGTPATARPKTSAYSNSNSNHSAGQTEGVDITNIVQEIVNRSGWISGNHIGFIIDDIGTTGNNYYNNNGGDANKDSLSILLNTTLANFKYTIFLNKIV